MNIELIEKLIEGYKELLDICKHQALLIEQHDLISIDDALSTRGSAFVRMASHLYTSANTLSEY